MSNRYFAVRAALGSGALLLALAVCRDSAPTGADRTTTAGGASAHLNDHPTGSPAVLVGAGDVAHCGTNLRDEQTANLLDNIPGTVMGLGDMVYENGTAAEFQNCYEPSWGRHKRRTHPTPGNHDYNTGTANAYFDYFGAAAGERGKGYYSYDLGDWHIVVLNSNNSFVPVGAGSAQEQWLRADLAATTKACVLAYWHDPRFFSSTSSSSTGVSATPKALWDALYEYDAEVIVNASKHHYERFKPMNPGGAVDLERGIRQFIVGTGGKSIGLPTSSGSIHPNSEIRGGDYGVLKLTLEADRYSWEFIPVAGKTFKDSGSGACRGAAPPPPPPPPPPPTNQPPVAEAGGPYRADATVTFDGSASQDPDNNTPLSYAWDFGDGTTGTGVNPTHTYTGDRDYTATLTVTDALGLSSAPDQASVTIANEAPTVSAGPDKTGYVNEPVTVSATFTDPGDDAPWSYTFDWADGSTDQGTTNSKTEPITRSHTYATAGTYTVRVTVTDKDGGAGSDDLTVQVLERGQAAVLVGAGDIANCGTNNDEATAKLLDAIGGTVFTAGDNALYSGTAAEYQCYDATWGRHKGRTSPTPGDKDHTTAGAPAYYDYFNGTGVQNGPAGERGKGYYSYDLGDWHVIALNSQISMAVGSAQEQWLRADLAATTRQCVLAYFHHPRFGSSGTGTTRSSVKPVWDALYQYGAELVVNAHYRFYERFAPQRPDGTADPERGIREFIVGTGGGATETVGTGMANSEVRQSGTFGVLKLTLRAGGYDWAFVPVAGKTFTDSGSGSCH